MRRTWEGGRKESRGAVHLVAKPERALHLVMNARG